MAYNFALILAGGTGSRAGGGLPKQFHMVGGKPMYAWSVEAFKRFDPKCKIIVVLENRFFTRHSKSNFRELEIPSASITWVRGGNSRIQSVINGLDYIVKAQSWSIPGSEPELDKVFIHDAARPLITPEIISRAAKAVEEGIGAIPVVPITDSLRRKTEEGSVIADRADFMAVQTPQAFRVRDIVMAYSDLRNANETELKKLTDDASVAERYMMEIKTVEGDPENFKVTVPTDFVVADALLKLRDQ